jgi:hypothetical protein
MNWVRKEVPFKLLAQQATWLDYLHEVEHMAARGADIVMKSYPVTIGPVYNRP